jgi:hypothetical protein
VFDPGTLPQTIIVAGDAGVARTVDLGRTWHIPATDLPTVQCTSLAIDPSASPSLLRVGTYGRSTFALTPHPRRILLTNLPVKGTIDPVEGRDPTRQPLLQAEEIGAWQIGNGSPRSLR